MTHLNHTATKPDNPLSIVSAVAALLLSTTLCGCASAGNAPHDTPDRDDALWVWENASRAALESESDLDDLIAFCQRHHISEIFIAAQGINHKGGRQPLLITSNRYEQWRTVLSKLHESGIRAQALLGKADWLMPSGGWTKCGNHESHKEDRDYGSAVVDSVLDYQNAHGNKPKESFDGIHFDIEIETLENANNPDGCAPITHEDRVRWFLEFIDLVADRRAQKGLTRDRLPFDWDIHMGFNGSTNPASIDYTLTPAGGGPKTTKKAWQHLFDRFERITFMTYGDRARYICAPMAAGLNYLDSLPVKPPVRFALEFQPVFKGIRLAPIGLANEDYLTFLNLRRDIDSIMVNRSYFRGWAMHPYDNYNREDGDYRSWLRANPPIQYPSSVDFVRSGSVRTIPTNPFEPITDKVHVRLRVKAHPDYRYTGHSFENFIMLIPLGYGYCSEEDLEQKLTTHYDGLAPSTWWYFNLIRWWPTDQEDVLTDVRNHGVGWGNPATAGRPHLGVERDMVLQAGKDYRFVIHYANRDVTWGVVSTLLRATRPEGNSQENPVTVTIYLGEITNYQDPMKPHLNRSLVITDSHYHGRARQ